MTRLIELKDRGNNTPATDAAEEIYQKAMKRVDRAARQLAADHAPAKADGVLDFDAGFKAARQELIIQLITWLDVELDGEVQIILYEDVR